jgi:hypothetical protein
VSQDQNPIERAVDFLVFAPIGVAMFAKDTVPTFMKMFVSRGQTELQSRQKSLRDHANQYRAVGKFAVKYGGPEVKRQAESKLDGARRVCEETFSGLIVNRGGGESTETSRPATTPAPAAAKGDPPKAEPAKVEARSGTVNGAANGNGRGNGASTVRAPATPAASTPTPAPTTPAPELAIPEYDQLSASQVVERLVGLTEGELDAVRDYELAHRGRNTILGKITQLTS